MEYIKQLEQAGNQAELLRLAETLPPGDALARVYIALSKLAEDHATTGGEYRQALHLAQRAITAADPAGLMWTWAQGRTAALAVDLGNYHLAERAGGAFVSALPQHPMAQAMVPWVCAAMGIVRKAQARYEEALTFFGCAVDAPAALAERIQLLTVWTLAECGRLRQAHRALPNTVDYVPAGFLTAAQAVVAAAAGDWEEARTLALAALRSRAAGGWRTYDVVQAAELMLILKKSAIQAGDFGQAAVWHVHTTATLSGWNADLMTRLLPTLPETGGELIDEAVSSCGPAGDRRTGLLGTLG